MENTFHILGQDIAFSQERINYVALKGAYYSLGLNAEKKCSNYFPIRESVVMVIHQHLKALRKILTTT